MTNDTALGTRILSLPLCESSAQSVLSASLSNSSTMARDVQDKSFTCPAIAVSVLGITQVRISSLPCLLLSSLLQKLAACCLFLPAFYLGVGLRGMNPADSRLSAAAQPTTLSLEHGLVGACLFI